MLQRRRDFFENAVTVAIVTAVPALWGCDPEPVEGPPVDQQWEARATELEAITWTVDDFGELDPSDHVPETSYDADARMVMVTVPHVMESNHWVTTIYIRDQDGIVLGLQEYPKPTEDGEPPTIEFPLHRTTTEVVAYAYCNRHDNWAEAPVLT